MVGHTLMPAYIKDHPLIRYHWYNASILLASAFDRAQHTDPYSIISKMQVLCSCSLVLGASRDFQMQLSEFCIALRVIYTVSQKGTPTLSINGFWRFLVQIFPTQLAIKWLFKLPPHPTSVSTLPGGKENKRNMHWNEHLIHTWFFIY